jgi:hypothetical protein
LLDYACLHPVKVFIITRAVGLKMIPSVTLAIIHKNFPLSPLEIILVFPRSRRCWWRAKGVLIPRNVQLQGVPVSALSSVFVGLACL